MRTFAMFAAIALAALSLTGCIPDKPAPRLDSPSRDERIEAVRFAQNRYGAQPAPTAPQPATDAAALIGRWNDANSSAYPGDYLFSADGTYAVIYQQSTNKGTWRLLSADTIEFKSAPRYFGMFGETVYTANYHISGDTLELLYEGNVRAVFTKARTEKQP